MIEQKRRPDAAPVRPIEFDINPKSSYIASNANALGFKPIFSYNGTPIQHEMIQYFQLTSKGFLPEVFLYFQDNTKMMHNETMPLDNTIISMLIRSSDMKLRPIRIDFKIIVFQHMKEENLFFIHGAMNVDKLYISEYKSYNQKTSLEVMDQFSLDSNIGFATNITATHDAMTWINPGLENHHFLQDTINKAYKDDSSFLYGFLDFFYILNYVDVEKQIRDTSDNPAIVTLDRSGSSDEKNVSTLSNLTLTNEPSIVKFPNDFSFSNYRLLNQSTQVSITQGYKQNIIFYDRSGNWDNKAGMFLRHDLNSLLKPNSETNSIILKDMPQSNSGFFRQNVRTIWTGILDVDNTHLNYQFTKQQNSYNLEEIQKINLEIDMNVPNFNIYRYQNIDIVVAENDTGIKDENINRRLTGRWLITGIEMTYSNQTDKFTQTLSLVRRELGA